MTLKELRLSTGLTQQEFADTLKINRVTVACWESGKYEPPLYAKTLLEKWIPMINDVDVFSDNNITIKEARKLAKLSQQKMFDVIGIPKRTVQEWESGRRLPEVYIEKLVVKELLKIAEENKESA